jgi:hypothetical protein
MLTGPANLSTVTDANGNYRFDGLRPGFYQVIPSLAGYAFNPAVVGPFELKFGTSETLNFTGFVLTASTYVKVPLGFNVLSSPKDMVIEIPVELTQVHSGSTVIDYEAWPGTAVSGSDYRLTAGSITIPAGSLSGTVKITVIKGAANEEDEYFFFRIKNVLGGPVVYPGQDTTTIWIIKGTQIYVPIIRK